MLEWRLLVAEAKWHCGIANSRKWWLNVVQPQPYNALEVTLCERPNGCLGTPRNPPIFIQKPTLDHAAGVGERDGACEIEVTSGFYEGDEHSWGRRVGNNAINSSDGEITTRLRNLGRLVVDDPVTNTGLHTS